jgi:hypothetical protein
MNEWSEGRSQRPARPEWWVVVPPEERKILVDVMEMFRGLKQSQVPLVARAAAKWELRLGCFIKVRLMNQTPKAKG